MAGGKFTKISITITVVMLLLVAVFVAWIDPYFHYHKPLTGYGYPMENEFYQNAGIAKNFEYQALVAGDSETQNIKASQIEELFGLKTVKLPNPGAPFVETDKAVRLALKSNPNIELVIRPMDDMMLTSDPYLMRYPKEDLYLYDENPFNDVRYLFEKETFVAAFSVLTYTRAGKTTISFDEYSNVEPYEIYGNYENLKIFMEEGHTFGFDKQVDDIYALVRNNVYENFAKTAKENPGVDFWLFLPPYSACFWKQIYDNNLEKVVLGCERAAFEELLPIENIKIYSFMDCFDITTDWNHYSDEVHFEGIVDDYIIESMHNGDKEITLDNMEEYFERLEAFYSSYNYDDLLINQFLY